MSNEQRAMSNEQRAMSNEQRAVTSFFKKRIVIIKEKISFYFFVNEEVAQPLEVTKESVWATAFRGLKPD